MTILDHYEKEKQRFLENCTQCGICAEKCPILPYTQLNEISSQDIQDGVFDFIDGGISGNSAYTKAFACMECFKCTADMCPEDLNPMLINELIKGGYISKGLALSAFSDSGQTHSTHRVLASVQVSRADYKLLRKWGHELVSGKLHPISRGSPKRSRSNRSRATGYRLPLLQPDFCN